MNPSLNALGGGKNHSAHWRFFNHMPEVKPWAREARGYVSVVARAIVVSYMGTGYPVETLEWDVIRSIEAFAHLGVKDGLAAYLEAVGRPGRVVLAAIRRNFKRRPELWSALGRGE